MGASPKLNLSLHTWRDFTLLVVAYFVTPGNSQPFWPFLVMLATLMIEPAGNGEENFKSKITKCATRLGSASLAGLVCAYLFTNSTLPLFTVILVWWILVTGASLVPSAEYEVKNIGSTPAKTYRPFGILPPEKLKCWSDQSHESATLIIGLILSWRLWPGFWINWKALVFAWLAFCATNFAFRRISVFFRVGIALSMAAAILALWLMIGGAKLKAAYAGPLFLSTVLIYSQVWVREIVSRRDDGAEGFRMTAVLAVTFWIYQPIAYTVLHGTGDALWYATILADMLEQVRHGVFPVWAGQSIYQFNGAIYPLRVAPAFHYVGAFFDVITLHSLNAIGVQNLMLVGWALFTGTVTYLCTASLMRDSRGVAVLAAILFVACPGVMSVVYYTDLYMSWMTIPFLPVVLYLIVKSFSTTDRLTTICFGAALGFMWWGHSPMALWTTIIAALAQGIRLLFLNRNLRSWFAMVPAAIAFAAVSIYPVTSVLLFPPEQGVNAAGFQQATAANIAFFVKSVFPDVILPIKTTGLSLSCFQLGYSLWIILLFVGALIWKTRQAASRLCYGFAAILAILLIPIPHLNETLWSFVPAFIRDTTGNWVMNRLYAILAGTIVFAATLAWKELIPKTSPRLKSILILSLLLLCGWSLHEARKFGEDALQKLRPKESAIDLMLPENAIVTRFAYLVFPQLPAYFSHGVVDPELENRFFSEDGELQWSNAEAVLNAWNSKDPRVEQVAAGNFTPADTTAAIWSLSTELELESNEHYLAVFVFPTNPVPPGVMQFIGGGLFREYELPISGNAKAFGSGPESVPYIPLWNTQLKRTNVRVRFIAKDPDPTLDLSQLKLSLIHYDRSVLPITVTSWIPYKVHISAKTEGWVETPRSFHKDFVRAQKSGGTIKKSKQDLVMVRVNRGTSDITLESSPSIVQQTFFWLSFSSIVGLLGYILYAFTKRREGT